MRYSLKYGSAVTVIPSSAAEKIISGAASLSEIAVLMAISAAGETEAEGEAQYTDMLCESTGLEPAAVTAALAFWRGASVIAPCGKGRGSSALERRRAASAAGSTAEAATEAVTDAADTAEQLAARASASAQAVESGETKGKKLMRDEPPRYAPEDIARALGRDGGALAAAIDQCQHILGWVFNPNDVEIIVRLNDHLGLEPEYILTLCAYYSKKRPGCKLHYIEKAAYSLANDGIVTPEALDIHIKGMELYDGVAGHLRKLIGIGAREFTKKENAKIKHWINELGYGADIIELCYEITVNSIGEFSFDYADKILDSWYLAGIRTPQQALEANAAFKSEHEKRRADADKSSAVSIPSFDGDEFLKLAVKRSLGG